MFTFSLPEAFLTLFIGMGPVKVLLIYIAKSKNLDKGTKRAMARRIVIVAGVSALVFSFLAPCCSRSCTFRLAH